jgi:hypothetical protein
MIIELMFYVKMGLLDWSLMLKGGGQVVVPDNRGGVVHL